MKRHLAVRAAALLFALVVAVSASSCAAVQSTAFSVDGYAVSDKEFLAAAAAVSSSETLRNFLAGGESGRSGTGPGATFDMAFLNRLLNQWIGRRIVLEAAAAKGITASDEQRAETRRELERVISQEETPLDAPTVLADLGSFLPLLIDYEIIKDDLDGLVPPDEAAARATYDADPTAFSEVCLSGIVVAAVPADQTPTGAPPPAPTAEQTEAATRRARELADQARRGADFAALARENSDDPRSAPEGGRLGCVPPESAQQQFPELARLAPGEIGEPVPLQQGAYVAIIRLDSAGVRSFEQVKDELLREQQSAGQEKVLLDAYASADVDVNPRYGTWSIDGAPRVVPPAGPAKPSIPSSSTTLDLSRLGQPVEPEAGVPAAP